MSDNTLNPMESKNIKDYLHLYIGCEMQFSRHRETQNAKYILTHDNISEAWDFRDIPILRQLSDMTEEEQIQLQLKVHPNGYLMDAMANEQRYFSFETTRQLLSKGFDLFNLIDAGLAIKKSQ